MAAPRSRPLLLFDGDCGFCRYWINYWQAVTGSAVEYAPYQNRAGELPEIPLTSFARSIYFIDTDGSVSKGAEASFRTLAHGQGESLWLTLYENLPGFATITEACYRFIASHRVGFAYLSRWLFGASLQPPTYIVVTDYLQRGIGLIYLLALLSFWWQALGLIGTQGIVPVQDLMAFADRDPSIMRYWWLPSLFWFNTSDVFVQIICGVGSLAGLAVVFAIRPSLALLICFIVYLSLVDAGQVFMSYQWDYLLLEAGFLAIFLRTAPGYYVWLFRWLLFRFMFEAGLVKWGSGDIAWQSLTALNYHFFTQPLPTPIAWYAQQLPDLAKQALTAAVLVIELILPAFVFMPRRLRFVAAWGFIALQIGILLTGNYGYFNLLALVLCLSLFDDVSLRSVLPASRLNDRSTTHVALRGAQGFAVLFASLSTGQMVQRWYGSNAVTPLLIAAAPLHVVNSYGPFAIMTKTRRELAIEGSMDGKHWRSYHFLFKPDAVERAPPWNIPHQPRLDWQFWFAALDEERPIWLWHFLRRLQQGSAPVLGLLAEDPFPGQKPRYVRVRTYDYHFTSKGAQWWQRSATDHHD